MSEMSELLFQWSSYRNKLIDTCTGIHLSLWCLHNPELAKHFDECHLGLHNCQSHANADSRSTSKWDEGTRMNGGLLGLAESTAEKGISMVPCSLRACVYVCESVCICIRWIRSTISPHILRSNEYCTCPCVLEYTGCHPHACVYMCVLCTIPTSQG